MPNKKFHAAFPQPDFLEQGTTGVQGDPGMSLRDYFAAAALQGLLARAASTYANEGSFADVAFKMADAMLKAREL